ncbi:MAG: hypothetical protein D6822_00985 [Cyanobacteria bacterium J149]|nr:MAG: hypothetical protein D6822_00985 [Cyanobacteria bacterium J149]
MLSLEPIFEFSRQNCVAICAFLVPANLIATLISIFLLFWQRSPLLVNFSAPVGCLLAFSLFFHVSTWLMIGVVTSATFILTALSATCTVINFSVLFLGDKLRIFVKKFAVLIN